VRCGGAASPYRGRPLARAAKLSPEPAPRYFSCVASCLEREWGHIVPLLMFGLPGIDGGQQPDRFQPYPLGRFVGGHPNIVADKLTPDSVGIDVADRPGPHASQVAEGEEGAGLHLHVEDIPGRQPPGHVRVPGG
jgi:hypothetical protein